MIRHDLLRYSVSSHFIFLRSTTGDIVIFIVYFTCVQEAEHRNCFFTTSSSFLHTDALENIFEAVGDETKYNALCIPTLLSPLSLLYQLERVNFSSFLHLWHVFSVKVDQMCVLPQTKVYLRIFMTQFFFLSTTLYTFTLSVG